MIVCFFGLPLDMSLPTWLQEAVGKGHDLDKDKAWLIHPPIMTRRGLSLE